MGFGGENLKPDLEDHCFNELMVFCTCVKMDLVNLYIIMHMPYCV